MAMRVDLLLFERFDLLDAGGPYEVFHAANRMAERRGLPACFEVRSVAATTRPVRAFGGLTVTPDVAVPPSPDASTAADGPGWTPPDVLVVPGAIDVDAVVADGTTVPAIRAAADGAGIVASVCTGSLLLGASGLLEDVAGGTTHHEDLDALAHHLDDRVVAGVRVVDAGRIVTGAGLTSGLATALHLVDRFFGPQLAIAVASNLEHPWVPGEDVAQVGASAAS